MSFRFLHIADLHLDAPFAGRDALGARLREAQRASLAAAVDAALAHRVHAFLIAGDLTEQDTCSAEAGLFLKDQLLRLHREGISVFYARGNHDPASSSLPLPGWVEVFDTRYARMVEVRDGDGAVVGAVVGAGFARAQEYGAMTPFFPRRHSRVPTVGLLHTQLTEEAGQGTPYAPVSLAQLESLGYDYWALGHIHRRQGYGQGIHYSGALCGVGFGDTGVHGGLLVEAEALGVPQVRFLPLAKAQWETCTVRDLAACTDPEQLFSALAQRVAGIEAAAPLLLRIVLTGENGCWQLLTGPRSALFLEETVQRLRQSCGALAVELEAQDIACPQDREVLRREVSLTGQMLQLSAAAATDDDTLDQLMEALMPLALAGCQGGSRSQKRAYVRSLLPGLEARIPQLMTEEESPR